MIELYEYLLFNKDEKADYLWDKGVFLTNIKDTEYSYNLYSLNGYYVEVIYSNLDNEIEDIRPFRKGDLLDKYLNAIDL